MFTSLVIHCSTRPCDSLESVKFQLYSHLPCTFLVYLVFLFCLFHISQYQKNHLLFVFECTFFPMKESWCICLLFRLVFFKFLTHNLKWERLCCLLVISTFFFLSISLLAQKHENGLSCYQPSRFILGVYLFFITRPSGILFSIPGLSFLFEI